MRSIVEIGDSCPSLQDLIDILTGIKVSININILKKLDSSRDSYIKSIMKGKKVYGYCTGLGQLYGKTRDTCNPEWEKHILMEHAMGIGNYAPKIVGRAFLTLRLAQLTRGKAPVRSLVAKRIEDSLNHDIIPAIPFHGSVGASGDLAPSAHAFLCLYYGEGLAYDGDGKRLINCKNALEKAGLNVLELAPGEALALINNTSWTTGLALVSWLVMNRFLEKELKISRKVLEASNCVTDHYSEILREASEYEELGEVLSKLNPTRCNNSKRLQDPYSLRCTPQILAAFKRVHSHLGDTIMKEACSSTENPVVINGQVYHWCGFHSINISLAIDYARIAVGVYANIIERRIAQLLRYDINGKADFLAGEQDSVGAMITQYTAAAVTANIRANTCPLTVHNIPTSGLQEDLVPMGPESGIQLLKALEHLAILAAIEESLADYAGSDMEGGIIKLKSIINKKINKIKNELGLAKLSLRC